MELSIAIIFFFAALIRSSLGFGDALFAMPLLSLFLGFETATPVLAVDALIISLVLLLIERKNLKIRLLYRFLFGAILGVPVGIYLITELNPSFLKFCLGLIILSFSIYKLFFANKVAAFPKSLIIYFGFISGMLGAAYNTNGPPAILYAANNFSPEEFKANLQGMLFPVNILIISGHFISGLWQNDTYSVLIESLIPISIGLFIGLTLAKFLNKNIFSKIIWIALTIISINLIVNSLV